MFDYQKEIFEKNPTVKYKIIPKGRRVGLTTGAGKYLVSRLLKGVSPLLWVDTVYSNIDRYYERIFFPELKKLDPRIKVKWQQQKKQLTINGNFLDFRSADRPENLEGFGYKIIFLNEAGIILKNRYLFENAIMPMLLDYPDSQLIAAGTPKGKKGRNGQKHKFYELYEIAKTGNKRYWTQTYTTYSNPNLDKFEIETMRNEMSDLLARQELLGEFVEAITNRWIYSLDNEKYQHKVFTTELQYDRSLPVYLSFDFNKNPVTCLAVQRPRSKQYNGDAIRWIKEFRANSITIDSLCNRIDSCFIGTTEQQRKYGPVNYYVTGDASGLHSDDPLHGKFVTYYQTIRRKLRVPDGRFRVPKVNPKVAASREQTCSIIERHPDFLIDKVQCPYLYDDMMYVEADETGGINKKKDARMAHLLDCGRYDLSTYEKRYWRDI